MNCSTIILYSSMSGRLSARVREHEAEAKSVRARVPNTAKETRLWGVREGGTGS